MPWKQMMAACRAAIVLNQLNFFLANFVVRQSLKYGENLFSIVFFFFCVCLSLCLNSDIQE